MCGTFANTHIHLVTFVAFFQTYLQVRNRFYFETQTQIIVAPYKSFPMIHWVRSLNVNEDWFVKPFFEYWRGVPIPKSSFHVGNNWDVPLGLPHAFLFTWVKCNSQTLWNVAHLFTWTNMSSFSLGLECNSQTLWQVARPFSLPPNLVATQG